MASLKRLVGVVENLVHKAVGGEDLYQFNNLEDLRERARQANLLLYESYVERMRGDIEKANAIAMQGYKEWHSVQEEAKQWGLEFRDLNPLELRRTDK